MENIIQQITIELVEKINKKVFSEECSEKTSHFARRKVWCLKKKTGLGKFSQSLE